MPLLMRSEGFMLATVALLGKDLHVHTRAVKSLEHTS